MRIVLIVLALAAAGFLVVQERGARAAADIQTQSLKPTGTPSPQELATAQQAAEDRGALESRTSRRRSTSASSRAVRTTTKRRARRSRASPARSPRTPQAWLYLSLVAQRYDSDLAAMARARARALEPPVPPAR